MMDTEGSEIHMGDLGGAPSAKAEVSARPCCLSFISFVRHPRFIPCLNTGSLFLALLAFCSLFLQFAHRAPRSLAAVFSHLSMGRKPRRWRFVGGGGWRLKLVYSGIAIWLAISSALSKRGGGSIQ
jgi:hypothetical protein